MLEIRHFECFSRWVAGPVLALVVLLPAGAVALAQARVSVPIPDWQKKAGGAMEFEVASVRQNKNDNPQTHSNFPLGPGDVYGAGALLRSTNLQLIFYIDFAYKVSENQEEEILEQLPEWARTEKFDIEAHADGRPTKDQMRLMMQALLRERFGFAMHYEMRETSAYALETAKPGVFGPQLRQHPAGATCPNQLPVKGTGQVVESSQAPQIDTGRFPRLCGGIVEMRGSTPGTRAMGARNIPIKLFADSISEDGQLVGQFSIKRG